MGGIKQATYRSPTQLQLRQFVARHSLWLQNQGWERLPDCKAATPPAIPGAAPAVVARDAAPAARPALMEEEELH